MPQEVIAQSMNDQRSKRESMSVEEATFSKMWEIAAIVKCWSAKATIRRGKQS